MPDYLANGKGHLPRIQSGRTSNRRRMMTTSSAKIALVTGASRGLGRNIATALARKGVDVIGTYHSNKREAEATVAAIEALGRKAVMFQLDTGTTAGLAGARGHLEPRDVRLPRQQCRHRHQRAVRGDDGSRLRPLDEHPSQGRVLPVPDAAAADRR